MDEAVRLAVRKQMASAHLTQYTVAQQAGVSQPVLCTWLGGKLTKPSGKNAEGVVQFRHVVGLLCTAAACRVLLCAAACCCTLLCGAAPCHTLRRPAGQFCRWQTRYLAAPGGKG